MNKTSYRVGTFEKGSIWRQRLFRNSSNLSTHTILTTFPDKLAYVKYVSSKSGILCHNRVFGFLFYILFETHSDFVKILSIYSHKVLESLNLKLVEKHSIYSIGKVSIFNFFPLLAFVITIQQAFYSHTFLIVLILHMIILLLKPFYFSYSVSCTHYSLSSIISQTLFHLILSIRS